MQATLSYEIYILIITVIMTGLMWIPYIVNRMYELGVISALWDPFGHTEAKAAWANRMMSAHENAVENLIIFAPLVLAAHYLGISNEMTAIACDLYLVSRAIHFVVFTFAVPLLRVVSFLSGFSAQTILAVTLLKLA